MQTGGIDLKKYLFILKLRWIMVATVFVVILSGGVAYCLFWPPLYEATSLIVVQPQKVPGDIIKPTVTTKIEERLQIITQRVLSRSRLTEIIERFDLYPKLRQRSTPDELAEVMRKDITIKITRKNYFTVSFLYLDAQTVAAVTNSLAAFYVDSNLRLREEDAVGTARFLNRELERMRNQLREWETKIADFKQKHLQELPETVDKNVSLMQQVRNQIAHVERTIQAEWTRITYIEHELGAEQHREQKIKLERAMVMKKGGVMAGGGDEGQSAESNPKVIKAELKRLLTIYTPQHPDVVRLKLLLKQAEAEQARKQAESRASGEELENLEEQASDLAMDAAKQSLQRLANNIAEAKLRKAQLEAERDELYKKLEMIQQRIDNAPKVGEALGELTRGYDELKDAFQKLHSKWLEANMSANLERTQRGEQFEVVDPAEVPEQPYQPNVKRAIPMSLALAAGLAFGLAFGLSYLDTSFTSVEQAERMTSLPVLVVVPPLYTREEIHTRRRKLSMLVSVYSVIAFFLLALVGVLVSGRGADLKRYITGWFT